MAIGWDQSFGHSIGQPRVRDAPDGGTAGRGTTPSGRQSHTCLILQCAWRILLQSSSPRANHTLRTLPPKLSAQYAQGHDEGMWNTAKALLGEVPSTAEEVREAERVARLPMRMGGLGLRSAGPCADRCVLGVLG